MISNDYRDDHDDDMGAKHFLQFDASQIGCAVRRFCKKTDLTTEKSKDVADSFDAGQSCRVAETILEKAGTTADVEAAKVPRHKHTHEMSTIVRSISQISVGILYIHRNAIKSGKGYLTSRCQAT